MEQNKQQRPLKLLALMLAACGIVCMLLGCAQQTESEVSPYAEAYISKVLEYSETLGDEAKYGLFYINDDEIPELTVRYYDFSHDIYTISPSGSLVTSVQELNCGRLSCPSYLPKQNQLFVEYLSAYTGDTQKITYAMDETGVLTEIDNVFSAGLGRRIAENESYTLTPEEEAVLLPKNAEILNSTLTAQEILTQLGYTPAEAPEVEQEEADDPADNQTDFDFTPYVGVYTADAGYAKNYVCDALDLTLNSDGSLSGGGALYSWSVDGKPLNVPTGTPPIEIRSGEESRGGPGTYTFVLSTMQVPITETGSVTCEEFYVIYPAGVADHRGGNTGINRIWYVFEEGGVWDMHYNANS